MLLVLPKHGGGTALIVEMRRGVRCELVTKRSVFVAVPAPVAVVNAAGSKQYVAVTRSVQTEGMVRAWRIGGSGEVAWINAATSVGTNLTAAIPPGFARYATVVVPDDDGQRTRSDAALVGVLSSHADGQLWWLGYLDTGVADVVCPDALRVSVYAGWSYVLLEGGAEQALGWRRDADATPWHSALPELLFPADRSWLVSTLWDDDWRCVGGSAAMVQTLLHDPDLDTRAVAVEEDATPPGHLAR